MQLRMESLFIIVLVSIAIFGSYSITNIVSASEEGVTSASGYQDPKEDKKDSDGIGNNAIFGGNVGSGTMNPLARLHISGS